MPLLGFKKRFAEMVEEGFKEHPVGRVKRQSIRAKRRDGRNPHPGEILFLYYGLRTKVCRKLGIAPCKSVEEITIDQNGINVSGRWLNGGVERAFLVVADGFDSFQDMKVFFEHEHGLPFDGLLIKW